MANLKPGERVTLIKKLRKLVTNVTTDDLILICGQFNITWDWDQAADFRDPKVIPKFEYARGSSLEGVFEYLSNLEPEEGELITKIPECWEPNRLRLFLSHSSKDKSFVTQLKYELADYGISSFVAHQDIEPTKKWMGVILEALETCHALAALLTVNFHGSNWTDQEIGYALRRRIKILPVRLGVDPHGFLSQFQGLPGDEKPSEVARQIANVLFKEPNLLPLLAEGHVEQFINCKHYKSSHKILARIEKMAAHLKPDHCERISAAVQTNGVLKNAYNMPDKVNAFLAKMKS
jgi:hypothetical protein